MIHKILYQMLHFWMIFSCFFFTCITCLPKIQKELVSPFWTWKSGTCIIKNGWRWKRGCLWSKQQIKFGVHVKAKECGMNAWHVLVTDSCGCIWAPRSVTRDARVVALRVMSELSPEMRSSVLDSTCGQCHFCVSWKLAPCGVTLFWQVLTSHDKYHKWGNDEVNLTFQNVISMQWGKITIFLEWFGQGPWIFY